MATDPIGYRDDSNLYAYVRNDPINAIDSLGTRATPSCPRAPCADIPLPSSEVREMGATPIARGSESTDEETGSNVYQNRTTGELSVAVGPAAGRPIRHEDGRPGFAHYPAPRGLRTLLRTHWHPSREPEGGGTRSPRTRDEHNGPSQEDIDLLRTGVPVQIVTETHTFTLYRENSQDRLHVDRGSVEDLTLGSFDIVVDEPE